jgi:hypothetical protein
MPEPIFDVSKARIIKGLDTALADHKFNETRVCVIHHGNIIDSDLTVKVVRWLKRTL